MNDQKGEKTMKSTCDVLKKTKRIC